MITTTAHSRSAPVPSPRRRGFSLTEVMIATVILGVLLSSVLSSFVMMARSAQGMGNYADIAREGRATLAAFGSDARSATAATVLSNRQVTLTVPTTGGPLDVTYTFNADTGELIRDNGTTRRALIDNIESFDFTYYNLNEQPTANPLEVKEIRMEALIRDTYVRLSYSDRIISARFLMRNKPVTN